MDGRFNLTRTSIVLAMAVVLLAGTTFGQSTSSGARQVQAALENVYGWVGSGQNGQQWRQYLRADQLEVQLAMGESADPEVLRKVLNQLQGEHPALQYRQVAALRNALQVWLAELDATDAGDLPALARAQAGNFDPVTPEEVARAKAALASEVAQLNAYLTPGGANGEAWKEYLLWSQLQAQLAGNAEPNLEQIVEVYDRFTTNELGLEMAVFADVARSLRRYLDLVSVARMENPQQRYQEAVEAVASGLEQYAQQPADEQAWAIGQRLGWFAGTGQTPQLVQAIRRRYSQPNLWVEVSEPMLEAGIARPVDQRQYITDVILRTQISGTAHTVGNVSLDLVPNMDRAELRTVLAGRIFSDTVGVNGPVHIYSNGVTDFHASKTLLMDAGGTTSQPATSHASTNTNVHGIAAQRGGNLVEKIAWKRVGKQKHEAEYVAARHAEARVNRQFDVQSGDLLTGARSDFNEYFRLPLVRRGEFPRLMLFRTSPDRLHLTVLQANPYQLGAPGGPPQVEANHDVSIRVHESMLNNLAGVLLAGERLTQDDVRRIARELNEGELPPKLQPQPDEEPWSITFANATPITTQFRDDSFTVTIRGRRFTSGDREFNDMNISVTYKIESADGRARLVRQGDLQILPPGFDPQTDTLSASQTALRRLIQRRLGDVFEPEIVSQGLQLPGNWEKVGPLALALARTQQGWLSLAWDLPAADQVAQRSAAAGGGG